MSRSKTGAGKGCSIFIFTSFWSLTHMGTGMCGRLGGSSVGQTRGAVFIYGGGGGGLREQHETYM